MGSTCCKSQTVETSELKSLHVRDKNIDSDSNKIVININLGIQKINNPQMNNKFEYSILLNTLDQHEIVNKSPDILEQEDHQESPINSLINLKQLSFKLLKDVQNSSFNITRHNISEEKVKSQKRLKLGPEIFVTIKQEQVNDHYELGDIISRGSYGVVRRVKHKKTQTLRAIKEIKVQNSQEKESVIKELNILKILDHPNILKVYELLYDNNNYYLITEYLINNNYKGIYMNPVLQLQIF